MDEKSTNITNHPSPSLLTPLRILCSKCNWSSEMIFPNVCTTRDEPWLTNPHMHQFFYMKEVNLSDLSGFGGGAAMTLDQRWLFPQPGNISHSPLSFTQLKPGFTWLQFGHEDVAPPRSGDNAPSSELDAPLVDCFRHGTVMAPGS